MTKHWLAGIFWGVLALTCGMGTVQVQAAPTVPRVVVLSTYVVSPARAAKLRLAAQQAGVPQPCRQKRARPRPCSKPCKARACWCMIAPKFIATSARRIRAGG